MPSLWSTLVSSSAVDGAREDADLLIAATKPGEGARADAKDPGGGGGAGWPTGAHVLPGLCCVSMAGISDALCAGPCAGASCGRRGFGIVSPASAIIFSRPAATSEYCPSTSSRMRERAMRDFVLGVASGVEEPTILVSGSSAAPLIVAAGLSPQELQGYSGS